MADESTNVGSVHIQVDVDTSTLKSDINDAGKFIEKEMRNKIKTISYAIDDLGRQVKTTVSTATSNGKTKKSTTTEIFDKGIMVKEATTVEEIVNDVTAKTQQKLTQSAQTASNAVTREANKINTAYLNVRDTLTRLETNTGSATTANNAVVSVSRQLENAKASYQKLAQAAEVAFEKAKLAGTEDAQKLAQATQQEATKAANTVTMLEQKVQAVKKVAANRNAAEQQKAAQKEIDAAKKASDKKIKESEKSKAQIKKNAMLAANELINQFNRAGNSMAKSMKVSTNTMTDTLKTFAKTALSLYTFRRVFNFGKDAVVMASDLHEAENVTSVVFGNMNKDVNEFAQTTLRAFGLSEKQTKKFMGTYGGMAKAYGFGEKQGFEMSKAITSLTGDAAAFYNMTHEEVYTRLKSIFTGETEAIKEFGLVMTNKALDDFAQAKGIEKKFRAMSEAEKTMLRYQFVMERLSHVQGTFVRELDSWAGQVRLLKGQFDELKTSLGQGFMVVLLPIIKALNVLIGKLSVAAKSFANFVEMVFGAKKTESMGSGITSEITNASGAADNLANSTGETADNLEAAKKSLMGFDKLYQLTDNSGASVDNSALGNYNYDYLSLTPTADEIEKNSEKVVSAFFKPFEAAWNNKGKDLVFAMKESFASVKSLLDKIGDSFKNIWTNGTVQTGIETTIGIIEEMFNSIGNMAGAFSIAWRNAGTGNTIVQNLADAWNNVLSLVHNIGKAISEWWKGESGSTFANAVVEYFKRISESAKEVTKRFLEIWNNGGKEAFSKILDAVGQLLLAWLNIKLFLLEFKIDIALVFAELLTALTPVFEGISNFLNWLNTDGNEVFKVLVDIVIAIVLGLKTLGPLITIVTTAMEIWSAVQTLFNTTLWGCPIVWIIAAIVALIAIIVLVVKNFDVFRDAAKKAWDALVNAFGNIAGWWQEKVATPLADGLANTKEKLGEFASKVKTGFGVLKSNISDGVKNASQFVTSTFQKMKDKVVGFVNAIKSGFQRVFNSLVAIVKAPINGVIKILNGFIRGLNKLSFTVPDWVPGIGGGHFGFNIPQIPQLAMGGYVKPNNPQLAIIGDNRHEGEIVAPESKITEAVNNALIPFANQLVNALRSTQTPAVAEGGDIVIPVYIGNNLLDQYIIDAQTRNTFRKGR